MIYNYNNFLKFKTNEGIGTEGDPNAVYWKFQLEDLLKENWREMSITPYAKNEEKYTISFKIGDGKYDYYGVLVENKNGKDFYYLEEPDEFIEKLKKEFWDNNTSRADNLQYIPKCLGDITSLKRGGKSGLLNLR